MKKTSIILISIIVIIGILAVLIIGKYNSIITMSEQVDTEMSNLDVMLQRRADLIPNLVNVVKGYTQHEDQAIQTVLEAREKLVSSNSIEDKSKASEQLTTALNGLMVIVENYPDLKASENFTQLSYELAGTENRISVARRDYNEAVKNYNSTIKKFPDNLIANIFGFNEKTYFETDEANTSVPKVDFMQ